MEHCEQKLIVGGLVTVNEKIPFPDHISQEKFSLYFTKNKKPKIIDN